MTNYRLFQMGFFKISISVVLCFSLCGLVFSDDVPADLEAYRAQVLEDVGTLNYIFDSINSDLNGIRDNVNSLILHSSSESVKAACEVILQNVERVRGRVDSADNEAKSIARVANALVLPASSNALCSCGAQLDTINSTLTSILTDCEWINRQLQQSYYPDGDGTENFFESVALLLYDNTRIWDVEWLQSEGKDSYYPLLVLQSLSSISNTLFTPVVSQDSKYLPNFSTHYRKSALSSGWVSIANNPFKNYSLLTKQSFLGLFQAWAGYNSLLLSSLNFSAETNEHVFATIAQTSSRVLGSVTNIEQRFSIFNDFVFSSDAPLSMYTDFATDGTYHDYLTNYYIKVSKGQQSGSDNYTNWFSRIEILLASLVFQDDGTNFVDDAENTSQMENTLSQSVDTLSQAVSLPQSVTGKIDNMGQSFLGLLGEWRDIVSGNSLPSQFVLCDINLGSQSRDSSGGSSLSSFRLETSLDSGEFRQFLDFCHAVTTILFTMLFVWLSIMLLSFLLASLAKLAQFCYLVYSALFGG